jgi:succinate dehydrogenase hydrophobic anchor subunit
MIPVLTRTFAGIYFWWFVKFVAITSILILLMFVFGSMKYVDFAHYAEWPSTATEPVNNQWFLGTFHDFMRVYPLAGTF